MSKKICRIYVAKDSVQPKLLPVLTREVRDAIQSYLFNQLRISNDKIVKELQDAKRRAQILAKFPEMTEWENPTDEELRELVEKEKYDYDGKGGWSYSVLDEPICVTGTLEMFVIGHQAELIGSTWVSPSKYPGFKFSEQVVND
jgi:hypothetical protein